MRNLSFSLALGYLGFVIYGSLVPLDFHPKPLIQAWQDFQHLPYLDLGIGSRADWVANILLFIPLSFLWMEVLSQPRRKKPQIFTALILWLTLSLLSVSIEFVQQFFPPRTVSQNDILAESMGAFIGIGLWKWQGQAVFDWLEALRFTRNLENKVVLLLYLYLAGLFAYSILPLDLTLSPVELYHKWKNGRLILVPFSALATLSPIQALYEVVTDILLWIPPAILWAYTLSPKRAWMRTIAAATIIELCQLFVFSRVSDTTDIFTAAVGGWVGTRIFRIMPNASVKPVQTETYFFNHSLSPSQLHSTWFLYGSYIIVLGLVFGYPYDIDVTPQLLHIRLEQAFRVPFTAYYFGTEFRAATEVLHKFLFFYPLGAILAFFPDIRASASKPWWKIIPLIALPALAIEMGQLFLSGKNADLTDWFIETAGGIAGYLTFSYLLATSHVTTDPPSPEETRIQKGITTDLFHNLGQPTLFTALIAVIGICFFILSLLPGVPYNVHELFTSGLPLISPFFIACVFCWMFAVPAWSIRRLVPDPWPRPATYAKYVGLYLVVAALGLRVAVPLESLHDIVGVPVTSLPGDIEIIGRLIALFIPLAIALFGAAMGVYHRLFPQAPLLRHRVALILTAFILLPISYVIVVIYAATDNLTELLREEGRSPAILALMAYLIVAARASTWLSVVPSHPVRFATAIGWLSGSLVLGYLCLYVALEPLVIKYGKVFSALQFLLSTDRDHLVSGSGLLIRFSIAHCGWILMVAAFQLPIWVNQTKHSPSPYGKRASAP